MNKTALGRAHLVGRAVNCRRNRVSSSSTYLPHIVGGQQKGNLSVAFDFALYCENQIGELVYSAATCNGSN